MNVKVKRTLLLFAIAAALYEIALLATGHLNSSVVDLIRGASVGLAFAGLIFFVVLMVGFARGKD